MSIQSGFEHVVREDELLAPYTWLRLGGPAKYFAEPATIDELRELVRRCHQEHIPVHVLGSGSNLVVRDEGVKGLVVHLSAAQFCGVSVSDGLLMAGGGAKLSQVVSTAVREGLAGLEPLAGIPGTVGGALHGNASNHGDDIGQCTRAVRVMTHVGDIVSYAREELLFTYHKSNLEELVVLDAHFALEPADPRELTKRLQKLWIVNKAAQPLRNQNTATLFKDAGGISASRLIEQAGVKGIRVGKVELSDRNANYLVTESGATSREVLELMDEVRGRVAERLGVELEPAIEIW